MGATMTRPLIKVGGGRGFVIGTDDQRYVITAAHLPPPSAPPVSFSGNEERTYERLLGDLADKKPHVSAECLFVDPIADIAVLGKPDGQEYYDEAAAFDDLVDGLDVLKIGEVGDRTSIKLIDLDGRWIEGVAMTVGMAGSGFRNSKARSSVACSAPRSC